MAQNSKLSQVLAGAKLGGNQSALSKVLGLKQEQPVEIPRVFTDPFFLATRKPEPTPVKNATTLVEQKPFTSSTPISDIEKSNQRSSILERIKNLNPVKFAGSITNPVSSLMSGATKKLGEDAGIDVMKLPSAIAGQATRIGEQAGSFVGRNLGALGQTVGTIAGGPTLGALGEYAGRKVNKDVSGEVGRVAGGVVTGLATSPLEIAQTGINLTKSIPELLFNNNPDPFIDEMLRYPDDSKSFLESLKPGERKLTPEEEFIKKVAIGDKETWKGYSDKQINTAVAAMWIPLIMAKGAEIFMIFDSLKPSAKVKSLVTTEIGNATRNRSLLDLGLTGNPSKAEIKIRRDQLARQYHPDLHPELGEAGAAKTKKINAAYDYLLKERKATIKESVAKDPFSVLGLDRNKADAGDIEKATYDLLSKNRGNREKLDNIYRARKYAQDELAARQAESLSARRTAMENVPRAESGPTVYARGETPRQLTVGGGRNIVPVAPTSQAIEFNILDSDRLKEIDSNTKKKEKINSDISKITSGQITEKEAVKLNELVSKSKQIDIRNEELRSQLISTSGPVSGRTIEARTAEPIQPTQLEPTQLQSSQITAVTPTVQTPTMAQPVTQPVVKPSALSKVLPTNRGIPVETVTTPVVTPSVEPKTAPVRRVKVEKVKTPVKKESALRKAIYPREDAMLRAKAEELNKAKEKAKIQKEKEKIVSKKVEEKPLSLREKSSYEIGQELIAREKEAQRLAYEAGKKEVKLSEIKDVKDLTRLKKEGKDIKFFEDLATKFERVGDFDKSFEINDFILDNFDEYKIEQSRGARTIDEIVAGRGEGAGTKGPVERIGQMVYNLTKKYDVKISERDLPRNAGGIFDVNSQVIGLKSLNNLSTAVHEITHKLNSEFNITENLMKDNEYGVMDELRKLYLSEYVGAKSKDPIEKQLSEGLSVFLQRMLENPRETASLNPIATEYILGQKNHWAKNLNELLSEAGRVVEYYSGLSDLERKMAKMSGLEMNEKAKLLNAYEKALSVLADYIYPIEKIARMNGTLMTNRDPSIWFRASKTAPNLFFENLNPLRGFWSVDSTGAPFKKYDFNFATLVKDIGEENLDAYNAYLIARSNYYTYKEAKRLLSINPKDEEGLRLIDILKKDKVNPKTEKKIFLDNVSKYREFDKKYDAINREILRMGIEGGFVEPEYGKELLKKKGYAPHLREIIDEVVGEERFIYKKGGLPSGYRVRKGSDKPILDPIIGSMRSNYEVVQRVFRQKFAEAMMDNIKGAKGNIQVISSEKNSAKFSVPKIVGNTIEFPYRGKLIKLKVSGTLANVFKNDAEMLNIGGFEKFMKRAQRRFVAGTTGALRPAFAAKNMIIDAISGSAQSRNTASPIIAGIDVLIKAKLKKDPLALKRWKLFEAMGGDKVWRGSVYENTPEEMYKVINNEQDGIINFIKDKTADIATILSAPVRYSEILSRFGEFYQALENGESPVVALEQSIRVTAPFAHRGSMGGSLVRGMLNGVPYGNAGMQVTAQTIEAIRDPRTRARAIMSHLLIAGLKAGAILLSLAAAKQKGDAAVEKLAQDYRAANSYNITNFATGGLTTHKIAVPSNYDIIGSVVQMAMTEILFDGQYGMKDYVGNIFESSLPTQLNIMKPIEAVVSWFPLIVKPIVEVGFNHKTFPELKSLEKDYMKYLPVNERYNSNTNQFAIMLGQTEVMKQMGLSPVKIEHLLTNIVGTGPMAYVKYIDEGPFYGFWKGFKETFKGGFSKADNTLKGAEYDKLYKEAKQSEEDFKKYGDIYEGEDYYNLENKKDTLVEVNQIARDLLKANKNVPVPEEIILAVGKAVHLSLKGDYEGALYELSDYQSDIDSIISDNEQVIEDKKNEKLEEARREYQKSK